MPQRSKWCLIGIPDHVGVIHVGGRIGAAGGPRAFRQIFRRLKGRDGVHERMLDHGDVPELGGNIEKNHRQASDSIARAQKESGLTVVVGGGHDHGFSHLRGIAQAAGPRARIACINIDAHLDVRKPDPVITSGSPFYLALTSGVLSAKRFIEFGIQSHCNAPALWDFVEKEKIEVIPFNNVRGTREAGTKSAARSFASALKRLARQSDVIVISLDLDAIASAYAPGVSAPQSEGFTAMEIIEMMEVSGREKKVTSLGIFELNPEHDRDDMTSRLAATAAYHFIAEKRLKAK